MKCQYSVPALTLEALKKGGFRVYIPDLNGTALFAFHANVNDNIRAQHPGTLNDETKTPKNGFWILEFDYKLKIGDVVNYWVFVNANHLGYMKDGEPIKIQRLLDSYTTLRGRCQPSTTTLNGGKSSCVDDEIIYDNFNKAVIDTNIWKIEHRIPTYTDPNFPFNSYENIDETRFIRDNQLHIKPIAVSESEVRGILNLREGCTGTRSEECFYEQRSSFFLPPVKSAKIVSKTSFKYGKVEIQARLPKGDWIIPVLQLEPVDKSGNPSNIWIAYSRGNTHLYKNDPSSMNMRSLTDDDMGSHLLLAGPVLEVAEPERSKHLVRKLGNKPFYEETHNYALEWTKDSLRFLVDSKEYGSTDLKAMADDFNKEYVLSIGVAVGGIYDFPDDTNSGVFAKPWSNADRNYIKRFFEAKSTWITTWEAEKCFLVVDFVRVKAI